MSQPSALIPSNAHEIAQLLSDKLIECISEDALLGGATVAGKLGQLRAAVWAEPKPSTKKQPDYTDTFRAIMLDLSSEQRSQLLKAYAQLGHLGEIANLAAREKFFLEAKTIPGGVAEFVAKQPDTKTAVDKLNQPVFEAVMTAHPTSVNSMESMKAQRDISLALEAIFHDRPGASLDVLKEKIASYAQAPLLNKKDGKDENFSVRDETQMAINFLSNIYDDLPRIYGQYDDAFKEKSDYRPDSLQLKIHLKSWGSAGDKDGNVNVTAEKTLEAIAMHTDAILERYLHDLGPIDHPQAKKWMELLGSAHQTLKDHLLPDIAQLRADGDSTRAGKKSVTPQELATRFDDLSKTLAELRKGLKIEDFKNDLQALYEEGHKPEALDVLRKARIFGFEFAKIEYRETAAEYARVVDFFAKNRHLAKDDAPTREKQLKTLLGDPQRPAKLYHDGMEAAIQGAATRYNEDNAAPIAYHTMKRMELARDFPDMIEDNVLAECGKSGDKKKEYIKAQGTVNMLEAVFVQQAATSADGRRPLLGIVPLFEEPETMQNIDKIMEGAYESDVYKEHLRLMADARHGGKPTQQIQIAQSDNARRAGIPAARAFIHEAHKKMHALNEKHHIEGQFYVGGSISDAYRNGVRALSASVNAFGMHKFAKFTFQGGDMLNYFNTPFSNTRLFTRQFVHAAEKLQFMDDHWEIVQDPVKTNSVFDQVAIEALKKTLDDYRTQDFELDKLGTFLAALRYRREDAAGNAGSRLGARASGNEAAPEATSPLRAIAASEVQKLTPIDITRLRTIGFSEAMQHNDILPSWIGAQTLEQHIRTEIFAMLNQVTLNSHWGHLDEREKDALITLKTVKKDGKLTAAHLHALYDVSPTFRDAMDKCAYGEAMTDMDRLTRRLKTMVQNIPAGEQEIEKGHLRNYMAHLENSYMTVGKMAYGAISGKEFDEKKFHPMNGNPVIARYISMSGKIAAAVTQALDQELNLAPDIHRKMQYRAFAMALKEHYPKELSPHDDKVMHCALDTVMHGRIPKVDDPAYGRSLKGHNERAANFQARRFSVSDQHLL